MSERSSSSSADARQEVGHDRDLVSSLSWHVQRAMLFGVAAFTAIAALYVVVPPTQPAEAIATLSAAVALGCAAVVLLNRLIGATHARAVAFLAATVVAVHPLGIVQLSQHPDQTVVVIFCMLAGAGVVPSGVVSFYLTLILCVGWVALRPPMDPHESAHWTVNVAVSAVASVIIAAVRERFMRTIAALAQKDRDSRRRLEAQTREVAEARDAALESARAKGRFLANMSHEIRTPLNGIIGMLSLLRRTPLHADQEQYLDEVVRSSELLMAIVNDILDVSKIEAGAVELELVAFDIAELMEEIASAHAATALHRGIELIADVDANLPKQVVGDPLRVRQIMTNLVSNAIKFTAEGEVVLSARLLATTARGTVILRLAVTDTGVGIPADKLATIFNPFSQADTSTTRQFGGTGLGLSICRQLAGLMGSELRVDSVERQGSSFHLELELEKEDLLTTRGLKVNARLWNAHVLIMDASEHMRATLQSQLAAWGIETVLSRTPDEAARAAAEFAESGRPVDVAIIDVTSLGQPIIQKAQELGALLSPLGCAMIAMGSVLGELRQQLDVCGFVTDLPKPIHRNRLLDALNAALAADPIVPQVGAPASAPPSHLASDAARTEVVPNGLAVLVAEDNETNQRVAVAHLRALGYGAHVVADGAAALAALEANTPHYACVLMDGQMPVMDGYATTREVRSREQLTGRPRVPIVALTANAMAGDRDRALAAGMDAYLAKPFTLEQLDETLRRCCANVADRLPSLAMDARDTLASKERDAVAWREALDTNVVDQLLMLERGSPGFFGQVVETYLSTSEENLRELLEAARADDKPVMQRRAHALLGSSRQVGAARVGQLCVAIERAGSVGEVDTQLAALTDELTQAQVALVAAVKSLGA
jgi:two-component system sensor histidine kinase/response regulator